MMMGVREIDQSAAGGVERGSGVTAVIFGYCNGQLVLEGSAAVCLGTVWSQPQPEQLT